MVVRGLSLDSTSVIDGLTFTNIGVALPNSNPPGIIYFSHCNNPVISNCAFTANYETLFLGRNNINPLLLNCRFYNNYFTNGSYLIGLLLFQNNQNTTLRNCVFQNNSQQASQNAWILLYNDQSPLTIDSCSFIRNRALVMYNLYSNSIVRGSCFTNNATRSLSNNNSNPVFTGCVFSDSAWSPYSSSIMNNFISKPVFTDCQFYNRKPYLFASETGGGVAYNDSSAAQFNRCVFMNCTSTFYNKRNSNMVLNNCLSTGSNYSVLYMGSFMQNIGSSPVINNCVIVNSKGGAYGTINNDNASFLQIDNTIFWRNFQEPFADTNFIKSRIDIKDAVPGRTIARNCSFELYDGGTANGNTTGVNPRFINFLNPVGGDSAWFTADDGLQLCNCSPAINSGNNTYAAGTVDVAGQPRVFGPAVDRGAYELQSIPPAGIPATYYVNASAGGTQSGENWTNAYNNLHTAIANPCADTIKMAAGIYKPARQNRDSLFVINRTISLIGSYNLTAPDSSRDVDVNPTILSGDVGTLNDTSDNSLSLMKITNADTVQIDGIVFKDINNTGLSGVNGTLYAQYVLHLSITNSRFYNNISSEHGGAVYLTNIGKFTFGKTVFRKNRGSSGGGLYCRFSASPNMITNCVFDSNYAMSTGGGVYLFDAITSFTNCLFNANTGFYYGGGMHINTSPNYAITNCTFSNNRISAAAGNPNQRFGAGITIQQSGLALVISNSIFTGNSLINQPGQQGDYMDISYLRSGNVSALDMYFRHTAKTSPSSYGFGNISSAGIIYKNQSNAIGPDNRWFTADDGLQLDICADGIDKGLNSANTLPVDLAARPRIFNNTIDLGPYEFSGTPELAKLLNTPNDSLIANKEITDASGWTHYYKDCYYLMSLQKRGQNIGFIGDGTFSVRVKTTPAYGTGTATDLSTATYINPGVSWKVMNRYWVVTPTNQPVDSIQVRFPYTVSDFNDIRSANPGITTHQQMNFYKVDSVSNPLDVHVPADKFHTYIYAAVPSQTKWAFALPDTVSYIANYFVKNLRGGGGGGIADITCTTNTNTWLGITPDWELASNWSGGQAPTVCSQVIVNPGVPFMPEITRPNSACYSLTLINGATIIIRTGGHLTITGP